MKYLLDDKKKSYKNKKNNLKKMGKGNVIVLVTKADLEAWGLDPELLASDENKPIVDSDALIVNKSLTNPYLLNVFVHSVDQSRWRVIQEPAFYSQLRKRFSIMQGSYLFICPTSPSNESVIHASFFRFIP